MATAVALEARCCLGIVRNGLRDGQITHETSAYLDRMEHEAQAWARRCQERRLVIAASSRWCIVHRRPNAVLWYLARHIDSVQKPKSSRSDEVALSLLS